MLRAGSIALALLLAGVGVAWADAPASAPQPVRVVICGSHHEVLPHWLRAVEDGVLPRELRVVHVDAHPDFAVPDGAVPPGRPRDALAWRPHVDIASFQLPAVWIGLLGHVVWARPRFATQLPDGERRFQVGLDRGGRLRVDDESDYYVLDGGWAAGASLRDRVAVRLTVMPLDDSSALARWIDAGTILDVDLDTFATHNPGADRLRGAGLSDADLDRLREIFAPDHLNLAPEPEARIRQFDALLASVQTLALGTWREWPEALPVLWRAGLGPVELFTLWRIVGRVDASASLDQLLEDGRQLVGLPEHVAVEPWEIAATAAMLRDALRAASEPPALVTVARSVQDGYTPRALWPEIEWALLSALRDGLGALEVRYDAGLGPAPSPRTR